MDDTFVRMEKNYFMKNILKLVSVLITSILIFIIFYAIKSGVLHGDDTFLEKISSLGMIAPVIFLFLQLLQIVIPVIPGGSSCLIGVLAFGPVLGFIYNYIGVVLGSILVYFLSKKYGLRMIRFFFQEETVTKYMGYISNCTFQKIFLIGIFLPGLPDDLLCYMAGISGISFKIFLVSILIGKFFSLFIYSFLVYLF